LHEGKLEQQTRDGKPSDAPVIDNPGAGHAQFARRICWFSRYFGPTILRRWMPLPLKPKPLRRGDSVAIVAPAGVYEPERLERGAALLESWGLRVRRPRKRSTVRYLAGSDEKRALEVSDGLADDSVGALLVARGGFGTTRLFDRLPLSSMHGRPKPFVGFSDATVLLTRLVQEAGWVAFHGPMVAADLPDLDATAQERFRRFLFDEPDWWHGSATDGWRAGRGSGRLIGGCLSLLVATLGTPYELRVDAPVVLFLEDVNEKPYRIERMLVQLRDAGRFENVTALAIGSMPGCDDGESPPLEEIFTDVLGGYRFPIVCGVDAGHGSGNAVLPFGCRVSVDADRPSIHLEESPFEA
jgi:muramoyltetrapeptide carboxypeptidase